MQTKPLLITITCFLISIVTTAQTGKQPFADLGKKVKVLTLTNGKYEEFFDDDSIQQIGTALVNIKTMQIVKFQLTKEEQRIIDNSSNARFLSVDPIANSYPMLTPYQYASNRPIDGIDLDGKEWAEDSKIGKTGTQIEVSTTFTVRVKVENKSKIITDPNIIKQKAEVYKNALESKFKASDTYTLYGVPYKLSYKTEVVLDYSPPTADDGNIGHLIFDDRTSTSSTNITTNGNTTTTTTITNSTPGETKGQINNFTTSIGITMDGAAVSDADMTATDQHEGGHSGGLNHPWKLTDIEKFVSPMLDQNNNKTLDLRTIKDNLMNSDENPDAKYRNSSGTNLLLGQLFFMWKKISDESLYTPDELKGTSNPNSGSSSTTTDDKKPQQ